MPRGYNLNRFKSICLKRYHRDREMAGGIL